jgi:hypothetical protein
LGLFRSEASVDLQDDIDAGGNDTEQEQSYLALPRRELRLDNDSHAGGHESPQLCEESQAHRAQRRHVVEACLPLSVASLVASAYPYTPLAQCERTSATPIAICTAKAASEGAVFGFGGLFPVTRTVRATTMASESSHPKMKAAPFRVPPLDSKMRRKAVRGIGSRVMTKPMSRRSKDHGDGSRITWSLGARRTAAVGRASSHSCSLRLRAGLSSSRSG